jgi:transposase-like protein
MSYGTGSTQCPKCGAVGTYKITLTNGGQVITCNSCKKNFTAEVKQQQFTGRNR